MISRKRALKVEKGGEGEYDFRGLSDEKLVALAQTGNERAAEYLLYKYRPKVTAIARTFDSGEIEDIAQEGMIGVLKAIRRFSSKRGASFKTFARLCARRHMLSAVRTKKPLPQPTAELSKTEEASWEFEELLLSELNELERLVLNKYLEGASYEEIAVALGINRKKVDNTLQRARKKVRRRLLGASDV